MARLFPWEASDLGITREFVRGFELVEDAFAAVVARAHDEFTADRTGDVRLWFEHEGFELDDELVECALEVRGLC